MSELQSHHLCSTFYIDPTICVEFLFQQKDRNKRYVEDTWSVLLLYFTVTAQPECILTDTGEGRAGELITAVPNIVHLF